MAWLDIVMNGALLVMVALLPLALYRVAKPKQDAADRLVGVDMVTNLLVGIVVLLAIIEGTNTTIDIGIVVAALSFAGTVSIARYISEGRVF
ncbi:MAG: monovalent cation/H+ antiporter complex subunit F [Anaerolineae bacterium]|nr:monovalent cation/H+ antiporter complex subunit F [Anaerolineae bacterium]